MATEKTNERIDFRIYLGMLFFRWQVITVCFLYCLLGGVLFATLAPKKYEAKCKVSVYRDPDMPVGKAKPRWASWGQHSAIMRDDDLRERVANRLADEWGDRVGNVRDLSPPVQVSGGPAWSSTRRVSVYTPYRDYGVVFLQELMAEYEDTWGTLRSEDMASATEMLEEELTRMEQRIEEARQGLIEFERLNDMARLQSKHSIEEGYITALVHRRHQLETQIWMLETQHPYISEANEGVLHDVHGLMAEMGDFSEVAGTIGDDVSLPRTGVDIPEDAAEDATAEYDWGNYPRQWPELRVRYARLQMEQKAVLKDLTAEHPKVQRLREEIDSIESELEIAAQIEMNRLVDRRKALQVMLGAVESAEYKWQAKHTVARSKQAEWRRLSSVVSRYENNYNQLYSRLHEVRLAEQVKAERVRVGPVSASPDPVAPDAPKIMLIALALGLGSGFGIALVLQVTDNKVQSISDVEEELGITFLGGVPFWAHSGLEKAIRPIVTEENATGATEAYRALRTSLLSAMGKINEKVVLVTSADSREGKTLTTLNIAIMIAQMGKRVLVVDMDLRRGRLHRSLGVAREPGVADVLSKGLRLADVVQKTRVDNLWLVPTGSPVDSASELLQATDLVGLFADIQDEYDYVLCDTSPILRVTDTVIAATQGLGVVVYVARVNRTAKPMIQYSLDMLRDGRVLGLIMNSIEMHRLSSLYYAYQYPNYAYYSNAYVYGYNYHHDDGLFDPGGWGAGIWENWSHRLGALGRSLRKRLGGDEI